MMGEGLEILLGVVYVIMGREIRRCSRRMREPLGWGGILLDGCSLGSGWWISQNLSFSTNEEKLKITLVID